MENATEKPLKPAHEIFASFIAQGLTQSDAYAQAFKCKDLKPERITDRASKLARNPRVKARVRALISAARITDIDSVGRCYTDLLAFIDEAKSSKNWTAVAALMRLRTGCLGMIKDTLILSAEGGMTDDQIISRLAGKDSGKANVLRMLIGGERYERPGETFAKTG